jgi:hypothetical protein
MDATLNSREQISSYRNSDAISLFYVLQVATRPWALPTSDATVTSGDLTKLCNHKRKLLAMATLAADPGFNSQQQQAHGIQGAGDTQLPKTKKGE